MFNRLCKSVIGLSFACVLGFSSVGCSSDLINEQGNSGLTVVEGVVLEMNDQTPVDGGVTIKIRMAGLSTQTLYFESMFTYPPPSDEHVALYERVRVVKIGDRVRAKGIAGVENIVLKDIEILE